MVIIGNNEMVDVDLRKLISCLLIMMSDDGVGVEAYYHEEVRKHFLDSFVVVSTRLWWYWRDGEMGNVD